MIYQSRLVDGNKEMRIVSVGDSRLMIHIYDKMNLKIVGMEVEVTDLTNMIAKCFEQIGGEKNGE